VCAACAAANRLPASASHPSTWSAVSARKPAQRQSIFKRGRGLDRRRFDQEPTAHGLSTHYEGFGAQPFEQCAHVALRHMHKQVILALDAAYHVAVQQEAEATDDPFFDDGVIGKCSAYTFGEDRVVCHVSGVYLFEPR